MPANNLPRNQSPFNGSIKPLWIILTCVFAALLAWAYWPSFSTVVAAWVSNPDYTHGFFVVPISLWLLWIRREHAPIADVKIDWRGLILLVFAGIIRFVAGRFYILQLDAWSIPIWVAGVVWLLFGWKFLKWAAPAIAFLWFATPLPGTIEIFLSTPLQRNAAQLSAWVLRLIGQPALVQGTTILLDDKPLDVERACSGLRMFYGIFALAVACVAISRPPRWKAVLVLLAAGPVAIIANVFRIVVTALLMKFASSESAEKFSHDFAGIAMIPLAVALFLLFLFLLGRIVERLRNPRGIAWLMKWCAAVVVLLIATYFWGRYQSARAVTTFLETAKRYESEKDWPNAVKYLTLYVRSVPKDHDTFTHLAQLFQEHAGSYQERLRAVDLLQTAWKNQPEKDELAVRAIQTSLQIQDFDGAIKTAIDLRAKSSDPQTQSKARKLYAESLYAYLLSDKNHGDYNWDHVKKAYEEELQHPDYEATHALILADIYRNPKATVKNDQREQLAGDLLDKVVKERAEEPIAWLGRFRYRLNSAKPEIKEKAEGDLSRAVELAGKYPDNPSSATVLVTAAAYKMERGDTQQATTLLEQALKIAPTDPRPPLMLADIKAAAHTKEATQEAVAILRKAVEQAGKNDNQQGVMLRLRFAALLAEARNLEEAESTLAPIEKLIPQISGQGKSILKLNAALVRSQILLGREGPRQAMIYLRDVLNEANIQAAAQQMPELLAKSHAFLGQLYSSLGLTDLALDSLRQASRIQPSRVEWQIQSAALARQAGDFETAEREYRSFVQKGQAPVEIHVALIEAEIKRRLQRRLQSASQSPEDAEDWGPVKEMLIAANKAGASPVTVRLLAAEIMAASGDIAKAEESLRKQAEGSPQEPAYWRSLALMRLRKRDIPGALQASEKFTETARQPIEAASLKSAILVASGKADEAINELSSLVEKAQPPDLPRAAIAFSQLLSQLGKPKEAQAALEKAHEQAPRNLEIADSLANTSALMQDWKALEKYENWLKTIEGEDGTLWRAYRAQRLIFTSRSIDDKDFQEAVALADALLKQRPHWPKSHYLQGEISLRMNRGDAATASFEKAWQYGGRGIILADRLIDLLARQGRKEDARIYVNQVRDYLTFSQGLFDRAIPYMTEDDESQNMIRTAEQWVKQNPEDAEAHLRLGRVLLMRSNSAPDDQKEQKKKDIDQAKEEFRRAIELSPTDIRPWAAIVMLFGESPETQSEARPFLEELSKQAKISELERAFVLAQLYEMLNVPSQAHSHYNKAVALVEADPKAAGANRVLGRAARFYLPRVPVLAETYARRAIAQDPANPDAKFVLLNVLVNQTDAKSTDEGLRLLDDRDIKALIDPANEARYRAGFLARRGRPEDVNKAIELLRGPLTQGRGDRLLLARLYETSGQLPPALNLLQGLVRAPNLTAVELIEFLRFWQQHFVATAAEKAPIQFAGQAKEVYQRLGELPNQLPERLRWQLREQKARKSAPPVAVGTCTALVKEALASPAAKILDEQQTKRLLQASLIVLLQEHYDECAVHLATEPRPGASPDELAVWLCHAYIAVPADKEAEPIRKQVLTKLTTAFDKSADVLQAIADCSFMAGDYETSAKIYPQVIQAKPDELMPYNNLALTLIELQKPAEARSTLDKALKIKPADPDLLDTQAVIEIIDGHADKVIPVLEKLVADNPENPVLRFHLAVAYNDVKDAPRARDTILTATTLGIEQRLLSPRDKKTLADLKALFLASTPTDTNQSSADASQAKN